MRPRRLLDLAHELVTAFRAEYAHHRRQRKRESWWQGVRFAMRWMWAWV